jgi:hypothetical protein
MVAVWGVKMDAMAVHHKNKSIKLLLIKKEGYLCMIQILY